MLRLATLAEAGKVGDVDGKIVLHLFGEGNQVAARHDLPMYQDERAITFPRSGSPSEESVAANLDPLVLQGLHFTFNENEPASDGSPILK